MCQALCLGDGETRTERPVHTGKEPQPSFRQSQADTEHYSADGAHGREHYIYTALKTSWAGLLKEASTTDGILAWLSVVNGHQANKGERSPSSRDWRLLSEGRVAECGDGQEGSITKGWQGVWVQIMKVKGRDIDHPKSHQNDSSFSEV